VQLGRETAEEYTPTIQPKHIWNKDQIARLMGLIMLNYPIGAFLFWKVGKTIETPKNTPWMENQRIRQDCRWDAERLGIRL